MNITEYLIQQSIEFNTRIDRVEEIGQKLLDKLDVLEYNIERVTKIVEGLDDARPIDILKGDESYEKYIQRD
tara:strand:- start:3525 stop:3740 length:216 start_codon:yes stop_codon:yes gene_type:complete